jgi:ion channel POLLUX/CASTOR
MSKKKFTLSQRIKYRFDNLMTGGLVPLVSILLTFAVILTFLFTLVVVAISLHPIEVQENFSFPEAFWQTLMHVIDQGTITGETGWGYRIVMLIPTVLGLLTVATLVALITTQVNSILIDLRKGRSIVVEEGHIVILGWSSKIFPIIRELIKANSNQKRSRIVILADRDKVDMEDEIIEKVPERGRTKIICRTGNPIDLDDLEIVNPHDAKSIIIVSPDDGSSDAQNVKSILAIVNHPNRKKDWYHIVAEINTDNNKEVANIIGGDELTLVISSEIIARIAVQTCLQSGLSAVYNKILDFAYVEIYFHQVTDFQGLTFKDALLAYENVSVIGIQRVNGLVMINPKMTTKIKEGDKIILIAEDDHILPPPDLLNPKPIQEQFIINDAPSLANTPRKVLILGWNMQGSTIIKQMNDYVVVGSEVCIAAEKTAEIEVQINQLLPLNKLSILYQEVDIANRKALNQLSVPDYTNVMILSYSDRMPLQEADAITLVTLMHLRDIKQNKKANFTIVSEMLDIKNRTLAEIARPDDFIISDHVISLVISQLAENKELNLVFDELFDAQGAEFYLKPASMYVAMNTEVNFWTVLESASRRKETAVGYRLKEFASDPKRHYGVVLNPSKNDLIRLGEEDKIIVIAEDL